MKLSGSDKEECASRSRVLVANPRRSQHLVSFLDPRHKTSWLSMPVSSLQTGAALLLLACAGQVGATTCDPSTFKQDSDYHGDGQGLGHAAAMAAGDCCAQCTKFPGCLFWSFGGGTCWFFPDDKGLRAQKGVVSGSTAPPTPPPPTPPPAPVPPTPAPLTSLEAFGKNSIRIRIMAPNQTALLDPPISALKLGGPAMALQQQGGRRGGSAGSRQQPSSPTSLTNGNLRVELEAGTALLTATRVSDGAVLLRQTALRWDDLDATTAAANFTRPGSKAAVVRFAGTAGERVYGLGEHKTGTVQQMPYSQSFADSLYYPKSHGSDVSVPMYLSSKGYAFVWNSPALGRVALSEDGITWVANATLAVDMWISAPEPENSVAPFPDLLAQYASAVGPALPMPAWSTGFIQCKDRYRNQTQLLDVARGYKNRSLPISMIVIDWFHWVEMGDWKLNPTCWPDPQGMVDELRRMGIELMVTFWPYMGQKVSSHWDEYSAKGYCVTTAGGSHGAGSFWRNRATPTGNALVDATNVAALKATFDHWYEGYGKYGIKAMWMDQSEPDHQYFIAGGQWRLAKGLDTEVLPAWTYDWSKGFADKMAELGNAPGEFLLLSRSAWAGTASHGSALWSGDIESSWAELKTAVTVGQGVGLSGIPLWTTDIGGYGGGDPSNPSFQQMIVRWFQFGAFCPLFRLHGHRAGGPPADQCGATNGDNEVWNLAPEKDHYDAIVASMELREELRSYVAEINNVSVVTGLPMMRAMVLEFPLDAVCAADGAEQQFMFGPDWLVAPVTAENATTWDVYLPVGAVWTYWWNKTAVKGGSWRSVDVSSLADFPLFKRSTEVTAPRS